MLLKTLNVQERFLNESQPLFRNSIALFFILVEKLILAVEDELKEKLGTKVTLNLGAKKGKIEIEYYSRDELERLIELLRSL